MNDSIVLTLPLTAIEVRAIRRGLKRLRYEAQQNRRRSARAGWQPEPGRIDINLAMLATVESLLDKMPFPDYPDDLTEEGKR